MVKLAVALWALAMLGLLVEFVIFPRMSYTIVAVKQLHHVAGNRSQTVRVFQRMKLCPKFGFPNPNKTNSVDVTGWTMQQAEGLIFGTNALERAMQATTQADSVIPNLTNKSDWFIAESPGLLETNIYQLREDIGNYTFIPGGHWRPKDCIPRWKVAIIIPYRNRSYHLPIFLRYLVPMLQRQRLEFGVFVVNQENNLKFNRAMLMNVGFLESLNFTSWDCFVFHDVDHVPMSDRNYYGCTKFPRHFITGDSDQKFKLPYAQLFGGVTGFRRSDVLAINGFPNQYWGWGGEDDDIYQRVGKAGLKVAPRPEGTDRYIGFYQTIDGHHESSSKNPQRVALLRNFAMRMYRDGLSNLKYPPPRIEIHPLYINISVNILKVAVNTSEDRLRMAS